MFSTSINRNSQLLLLAAGAISGVTAIKSCIQGTCNGVKSIIGDDSISTRVSNCLSKYVFTLPAIKSLTVGDTTLSQRFTYLKIGFKKLSLAVITGVATYVILDHLLKEKTPAVNKHDLNIARNNLLSAKNSYIAAKEQISKFIEDKQLFACYNIFLNSKQTEELFKDCNAETTTNTTAITDLSYIYNLLSQALSINELENDVENDIDTEVKQKQQACARVFSVLAGMGNKIEEYSRLLENEQPAQTNIIENVKTFFGGLTKVTDFSSKNNALSNTLSDTSKQLSEKHSQYLNAAKSYTQAVNSYMEKEFGIIKIHGSGLCETLRSIQNYAIELFGDVGKKIASDATNLFTGDMCNKHQEAQQFLLESKRERLFSFAVKFGTCATNLNCKDIFDKMIQELKDSLS